MNRFFIVSGYEHNARLRQSVNRLAGQIFHIDFERWYAAGGWDEQCRFYSCIDSKGDIAANVTVNDMELVAKGHPVKALQLGTVMTRPDCRGIGLARSLIQAVLETYESDSELVYLFANRKVLGFYPRFGFQPLDVCRWELDLPQAEETGAKARSLQRLQPAVDTRDLELIRRIAKTRRPVSDVLGVANGASLLLWYALNPLRSCFHYDGIDDALLVFETADSVLRLYDIVATDAGAMQRAFRRLPLAGAKRIVFYFHPDVLQLEALPRRLPVTPDSTLFVRGAGASALPAAGSFAYPATGQT